MGSMEDGVASLLEDGLLDKVCSSNNQSRLQAHGQVVTILQGIQGQEVPLEVASAFKDADPTQLDRLVEGTTAWLASSNFKIALNGLEVLLLLVDLQRSGFRHYLPATIPNVIDKLGDAKDIVRESTQNLLLSLMEISSPQFVFERSAPNAFTHKLWRVREEIMISVCNTLNTFGSTSLSLSKFVPSIIKLVSDAQGPVRDQAVLTLVEIYRHVGERARTDLMKKAPGAGITDARLRTITARFDEVRDARQMITDLDEVPQFKSYEDEPESAPTPSSTSSGASSREHTFTRPIQHTVNAPVSASAVKSRMTSGAGTRGSMRSASGQPTFPKSEAGSGAINEDEFIASFEDVPRVQVYTPKDFEETVRQIKDVLSDDKLDWEKRVAALKRLRGLMISGCVTSFPDEFHLSLRTLENPFVTTTKDLRSQVVREACVTIAYMSKSLGTKFDRFAESILPTLVSQLPSSAKIMSTAAATAIRFIIYHTPSSKVVPTFISNLTSKNVEIRKRTAEFMMLMLENWDMHYLERHQGNLCEALKKGISDADSEARALSRKAFWQFHRHFPDQANALMNSLEPAKQKALNAEMSGSTSKESLSGSSTGPRQSRPARSTTSQRPTGGQGVSAAPATQRPGTSGASRGGAALTSAASLAAQRTRSVSSDRILDEKPGPGRSASSIGGTRRQITSGSSAMKSTVNGRQTSDHHMNVKRSNSAADILDDRGDSSSSSIHPAHSDHNPPEAANHNAQHPPRKSLGQPLRVERRGVGGSKPAKTSSIPTNASPSSGRDDGRGRTRSKVGVSQSQPGSRTGSRPNSPGPSNAYLQIGFSMDTASPKGIEDQSFMGASPYSTPTGRSTGVVRGTGSTPGSAPRPSRIPRSANASRESSPSRLGFSAGRDRRLSSGSQSGSTPMSTSRRNFARSGSGRNGDPLSQRVLTYDKDSEAAITDMLTRDGAGAMPTRRPRFDSDDDASETSSVSGSERSFTGSMSRVRGNEDVNKIFENLCSASWAERRDALTDFNKMLQDGRFLNRSELKRVTDIFTRMFHDHHQKVLSLFLDTLVGFLEIYKDELLDWLYVLLLRLLHRMGTDLLASAMGKVTRALETVRDVFPTDHQWNLVARFLVDSTQTPNMKVKMATMTYLHSLSQCMDPSDMSNSQETRMALSRIIQWTTEPKSADVRRASQLVVVALFDLNPSVMSAMLNQLSKSYQEGAHRLIQTHLKTSTQPSSGLEGPSAISSPPSCGSGGSNGSRGFTPRSRGSMSPRTSVATNPYPGSLPQRAMSPGNDLDDELENLNPEDIHNSIRQTTRQIANLSLNTHDDAFLGADLGKDRKTPSQDSGIGPVDGEPNKNMLQQLNINGVGPRCSPAPKLGPRAYSSGAMLSADSGSDDIFPNAKDIDFKDGAGATGPSEESEKFTHELVGHILSELSFHNERNEARKHAMSTLMRLAREARPHLSSLDDGVFNSIVLMLLEILGDDDASVRTCALKVFQEIVRSQPERFQEFLALAILKILEANKDVVKDVVRAAEDAALTMAELFPGSPCMQVLIPIADTGEYPVNLAAIKMMTKVVEKLTKEEAEECLAEIIPKLVKGYDNGESSVRKASVFCLVALHQVVGEDLKAHLSALSGSKMKLLQLYIRRAQASSASSAEGSPTRTNSVSSQDGLLN